METRTIDRGGRERRYLLRTPATIEISAPLVVQLHGRGIDAARFDEVTGFGALADKAGFVLAMPEAVGDMWNDGRNHARDVDDVGFIAAVIDEVCDGLPVDRGRVYLAGMSNGAAMAGRFACERPGRLTAFAQVAGTAAAWIAAGPKPTTPVPLLQIHGDGDNAMPYAGGNRRGVRLRLAIPRAVGPAVGVEDWARFWIEADGALEPPEVTELPPDTTVRTWRDAAGEEAVVFYRVRGGGHTWPGTGFRLPAWLLGRTTRTFDATETIWEFFSRHRRRDA